MESILSEALSRTGLLYLAGLWLLSRLVRAMYNISPFHPLSHIPGPRLAALTFLYEAWFDLILGGRYTREIQRMHEVYGPVVRINPEELHFNDINFVDEIYATGKRKRNKQVHFLNFLAGPVAEAMVGAADHDHHRLRRSAANKFFSRAQISKLESGIKELAEQLCTKLIRLGTKDGKPLDVITAYSCFTSDVISGYCFGEPFGFVQQEGWEPNFRHALNALLGPIFVFRFFPPLRLVVDAMPFLAKWLREDVRDLLIESNEKMPDQIRKARREHEMGITPSRPAIFHTLVASNLPEHEKTDRRLGGESFAFMTAGTETTAWTLTVTTFHLLNKPELLSRLAQELDENNAINLSWVELEKLPYLRAVIAEGLRLSYGVTPRLARIAPDERLIYCGRFQGRDLTYAIPPGTPMGMSTVINHHNEDVFPDSHTFQPERWLQADEARRRRMDASFTPFSRGSRQCLGMNLAYCNLYVALTALTVRVLPRMKLYDTSVEDVTYDHDLFVPMPRRGSNGVKVVIS
ncbi:cytochrome P450 [Aspergillus homomorphus CBS 101889]|uniref:Putative cytochrome P450 n=1 Tax=Aspergillus homomorphus (strain CBS 101889) TaxID=1450537 RepID=A0A395HPK1_ASPHC|nr:putative cytochrome P450 [Aspergillus homomorphus CBS 101889]RAL08788.1 putative cytochrome P450 [Aspergillus homomorphus CBS 101889]